MAPIAQRPMLALLLKSIVAGRQQRRPIVLSISGVMRAEAGRAVLESYRGRSRRTPGSSNNQWWGRGENRFSGTERISNSRIAWLTEITLRP